MTLTGFIAYSGALAVAAAIPGPGVTALVARALGSGFRSSLFMAFGLVVGDLTYLTAVVLGLAFVAQTFGAVFLAHQVGAHEALQPGPAALQPRRVRTRRGVLRTGAERGA